MTTLTIPTTDLPALPADQRAALAYRRVVQALATDLYYRGYTYAQATEIIRAELAPTLATLRDELSAFFAAHEGER